MSEAPGEAELPRVSVVFISYNRPHTLVAAVEAFLAHTDYPRDRLELILSDDASNAFTRMVFEQLPFDRRLVATRNQGLGANQNQGIRASNADYLLMIQDDWMLVGPVDYLRRAIAVLECLPDTNVINFIYVEQVPVVERISVGSDGVVRLGMRLNPAGGLVALTDQPYSDQPHLKRRTFHERFGFYDETLPIHRLELGYARALARNGAGGFVRIEGLEPFRNIGSRFTLNPGNWRAQRIERWGRIPLLGPIYRASRRVIKGLLKRH